MNVRSLKAALRRLDEEGGESAVKKLILAVPFKRGASGYTKDEIVRLVAHNRGESVAKVKKYLEKGHIAALVRAYDLVNYYVFDADIAFLLGGKYGGYEHTSEVQAVRPDALVISKAEIIDDGAELHDDLDAAVHGILYGSRNPYYEAHDSRRSRYNPRRRR
jgi:hypothetical protein